MQDRLPGNKLWYNQRFLSVLKNGVAAREFVKIKGRYKLDPVFKKRLAKKAREALKPTKKPTVAKTSAKKKPTTPKHNAIVPSKSWNAQMPAYPPPRKAWHQPPPSNNKMPVHMPNHSPPVQSIANWPPYGCSPPIGDPLVAPINNPFTSPPSVQFPYGSSPPIGALLNE